MDPNQPQNPNPTPDPNNPWANSQPTPQVPSEYSQPQPAAYDPNYLDSIAAAPPRQNFLSGTFGKVFVIMMVLLVLGVSLIVALGDRKPSTITMQTYYLRLDNMDKTVTQFIQYIRSSKLSATNTVYRTWIKANEPKAEQFLVDAGVKRSKYSKPLVATESSASDDLNKKLDDARLNAMLDTVYARTMANETEKMIILVKELGRSSAKPLVDYSKETLPTLQDIHDQFANYIDDGN